MFIIGLYQDLSNKRFIVDSWLQLHNSTKRANES